MRQLESDVELWQAGLGPKPTGAILHNGTGEAMTDPNQPIGSVKVVQPEPEQPAPPAPMPSSTFQKPAPSAMAVATGTAPAVADTHEPFVQLTSEGNVLYALDRGGRVWEMETTAAMVTRKWHPLPTEREQT
jgi:hypothetical protein